MLKGLWLGFILICGASSAHGDFAFSPRYEYITGKESLANRLLLKSKLNGNAGPFGLYIEGFGEMDGANSATRDRRSPSQAYLQEAFLEFKMNSFYFKVGRQAMRWSESWSIPSLDVWTGRRFNRLFFDPLAEQLTHSTGASFSYASEKFSFDLVAVNEVAKTIYPEPFPATVDSNPHPDKDLSYGGKVNLNLGGFGLSTMSAQVNHKNYYGVSANYAFEKVVPKIEFGTSSDDNVTPINRKNEYFGTLGSDIFWGHFILLPQVTFYDFGDLKKRNNDFQSAYYLSLQWNPNRHDLQSQIYFNSTTQDSFASLSYGYNLTDYFTLSGFMQNYQGIDGGLYNTYKDITGGFVVGMRMELTGNLAF